VTVRSNNQIEIGSYGWRHAQWRGSYYPDELPEDWRFSFYSKEFRTVLLSAAELLTDLQQLQKGQTIEWLDDLFDDYNVFVELNTEILSEEYEEVLLAFSKLLEGYFSAWVIFLEADSNFDIGKIIALSEKYNKNVHLVANKESTEDLNKLIKNQKLISFSWTEHNPEGCNDCRLMIVDLDQYFPTLRQLSKLIQEFIRRNKQSDKVILFKGNPPKIKIMKETQAIISLL